MIAIALVQVAETERRKGARREERLILNDSDIIYETTVTCGKQNYPWPLTRWLANNRGSREVSTLVVNHEHC